MAVGMRPNLGMNLAGIVAGDQWQPPQMPPMMPPQMPQQGMEQAKPRSKGQMIAGILGDALLGFGGQQGQFGPMLARENQQRQADAREEAQWTRRQKTEDDRWTQRETFKRNNPDPTAMERNLATFQGWGPDQRKAYGEMQQADRGDPFVTTSLPNGQFYAGPQSGLLAALTGQASTPAQKPVITPDLWDQGQPAGGGVRNGTSGFRP